jgi:hypothetical protein
MHPGGCRPKSKDPIPCAKRCYRKVNRTTLPGLWADWLLVLQQRAYVCPTVAKRVLDNRLGGCATSGPGDWLDTGMRPETA